MGVTGLWTVVQPCARPIKLETLNKKRLAVDASIWIYQFLKAVRDKEGNALRNSHVVGFFRRICKLLFVGVRPVFVFDGGAPPLKRQTVSARRQRREGRREDAARTAGKMLAVQMQRRAEEEEDRRKKARGRGRGGREEEGEEEVEERIPDDVVYAEEVTMTERERRQGRGGFKKKDAYHLPELDVSLAQMGAPNDPRIMSLEELEDYARQFEQGEDINVYDFSKIDFDSPFFLSLPATDRYNILNAARLRSRLRMGYSKDQLDSMFQDRMAFSKFQIERVTERNELTQRLMNINNGDTLYGMNAGGRIAGEKNREYVLIKNEGVEGGWALGVVDKDEGRFDKPIDVDRSPPKEEEEDEDDWEDGDDFEDVPIEGLNRLPRKQPAANDNLAADLLKRRQDFYQSRKSGATRRRKPRNDDPDSLFVGASDGEEEWENVDIDHDADALEQANEGADEDDEELQRAIAMSLQQDNEPAEREAQAEEDDEDDFLEVFAQQRAEEAKPFTKGKGLAIARMANNRSARIAKPVAESDSEDDIDLQAALAESRKSKHKPARPEQSHKPAAPAKSTASTQPTGQPSSNTSGFKGPLPFERLNLGSSLLGKKKMEKLQEEQAGGFERSDDEKKKAKPLPPWLAENRDVREDFAEQRRLDAVQRERDREELGKKFEFQQLPKLMKHSTNEVIDLEATTPKEKVVVDIQSSEDEEDLEMEDVMPVDHGVKMGDLTDKVRAEPPQGPSSTTEALVPPRREELHTTIGTDNSPQAEEKAFESEEEPIEWSESDSERPTKKALKGRGEHETNPQPIGGEAVPSRSRSTSPEFETVINTETAPSQTVRASPPLADLLEGEPAPADQEMLDDDQPDDNASIYSDPEDEELFRQLADEASEHARFASTLNHKSQAANALDYERELKALRNQQKKDRRDADEVTATMVAECQQLLSLFGLPYITAPMEAEAQCAELVRLGLVDGIVTDDSDVFLFGGTRVYKNMFNQAKFVECYLAHDLEAEFGLGRERLIAAAQLLGSDYAEGVPGVGPVTAVEILDEFGGLAAFRDWWRDVQSGARPRDADAAVPFRRKFRKRYATKLFLPHPFPDPRVEEAYRRPEVDSDATAFAWGVPDLDALRGFLMSTIGWSSERTDEVLVPVIRDMNTREREGTQSNITAFLEKGSVVGAGAWAPRVVDEGGGGGGRRGRGSGRLVNALRGIGAKARGEGAAAGGGGGDADAEAEAGTGTGTGTGTASGEQEGRGRASAERTMRKGKGAKRKKTTVVEDDEDDGDEHGGDFEEQEEEEADGDAAYEEEPTKKKARKGASGARGSRGRGRGRGRGERRLNNADFIRDAMD
ncbi:dna excision repair protein ercc-5 [Diplodia corticola]|uniref:Dna excision repair protein ercc-5 n=1 Tax=Diplodia corticola TaxID=236234 RepID=A0A1J9R064_9PEZI|nr:dna excision repair protein ercc-5 [Diplodia corticola]OJD33642.1 dna excision repair protein ercc-5 [Diplodia corticola]